MIILPFFRKSDYMNPKYKDFILSVNNNSQNTMKKYSWIGDLDNNITAKEFEKIIIDHEPKSKREITVILNTAARYAKYCGDNNILNVVEEVRKIGRKNIWLTAKPNAKKIFISHSDFEKVKNELDPQEKLDNCFQNNTLFYRTLFWAVYEGIFNYNMDYLENLRATDIDMNNNSITLRDNNNETIVMEDLPEQLLIDLSECSKKEVWIQNKRGGSSAPYDLVGKYNDSCFKSVHQKANHNLKASYQEKLKKITNYYFSGTISPTHIYYSGIAYRIGQRLKVNGITIEEAFRYKNNSWLPTKIIEQELKRSHYNNPVSKFKEIIDGHLEIMED